MKELIYCVHRLTLSNIYSSSTLLECYLDREIEVSRHGVLLVIQKTFYMLLILISSIQKYTRKGFKEIEVIGNG